MVTEKTTIELAGMEFHAFHGCLDEEKTNGNTFIVDFKGDIDISAAAKSDELATTVDYSQVFKVVEREMMLHSDLLEHLCNKIMLALQKEFPQFARIELTVSKKNPPVGGACAWARVSMVSEKD